VFVTLRLDGRLRGCIGRFVAARPRLVDELLGVAILAAPRDPRNTPVRLDELTDLRYEVSVLGELESVTGLDDLDPRVYGLMVQAERRRGGPLPGVPGVETAAQQVVIARIEAGIRPDDPGRLFRFRARRYAESGVDPGDPREPDGRHDATPRPGVHAPD
jgi:AMMECR1 domain-containing protein